MTVVTLIKSKKMKKLYIHPKSHIIVVKLMRSVLEDENVSIGASSRVRSWSSRRW